MDVWRETCHADAEVGGELGLADMFDEVYRVLESRIGGDPVLLTPRWIWKIWRKRKSWLVGGVP